MLPKFEAKTARVKGMAFHISRTWALISMHNGSIELWDYHIGTQLESFTGEHDGPVRSVAFHNTQPIFASGGDDYKVKLWNFKQRRCIFTLVGHLDYIRTVTFHHDLPWLMSSSDDQTIRIWNWQSRSSIAILTGHNHYIMCAMFSPVEDLIVSASLDQTARIWDFKNLKQKFGTAGRGGSTRGEIFSGTDVVVKHTLEGHDRGVNWASFHPNAPYVVTSADDRTVRLWRYTETKAWEVETMRGHSHNVSCAVFNPKMDIIISNSEDKMIKVWDMNRRSIIHTHRRDNDRFWVLAAHPEQSLIGAGFDSGFMIFRHEKERVPAIKAKGWTFFSHKKMLKAVDDKGNETLVSNLNPPAKSPIFNNNPESIQYNSYCGSGHVLLLQYDIDEPGYFLFELPKNVANISSVSPQSGAAISCCFVGKDKFAILKKSKEIHIMDFQNNSKKKLSIPHISPDAIFPAGSGRVMLKTDERVYVFDITSKEILSEAAISDVKQVVWSPNNEYVGFICKNQAYICNKSLVIQCVSPKDRNGIKAGAWEASGVFIYSSNFHIHFLLINGDSGVIRNLDSPAYLISIEGNSATVINKQGEVSDIEINPTEFLFKLALHNRRYNEVSRILEGGKLCGNSVVNYLQKKNFPEIALYFVEDHKTRFNLAIQAGLIETALESAYHLNKNECWHWLGVEALRQGNSQIVELAYQRTKNFNRLSMLYLITGNKGKISKMQMIATKQNDFSRIYHNSLYRGDIEKRIQLLAQAGQVPLAYYTAKVHNVLHLFEGKLEESLGPEFAAAMDSYADKFGETRALVPPIPIFNETNGGDQNWPLHNIITSEFEMLKNQTDPANPYEMKARAETATHDFSDMGAMGDSSAWGDVGFDFEEEAPGDDIGNWGDDDFDIPDLGDSAGPAPVAESTTTTGGIPQAQKWARTCQIPGELIACGAFQQAMQILTTTVGIKNFVPLKEHFMNIYLGAMAYIPTLPHMKSIDITMSAYKDSSLSKPHVSVNLNQLINSLKKGYALTSGGKFVEVLPIMQGILHSIPLLSVRSEEEEKEAKELVEICVEYIGCVRLELAKQEALKAGDTSKALELGYYMTLCNIQPPHQGLALQSAISLAYKFKNLITCTTLNKRFLELANKHPNLIAKDKVDRHKKLLAYCQQTFTNSVALSADLPENAADIASILCPRTYTQVGPSVPTARCPFCRSLYVKEYKGSICDVCDIAEIGIETLGLRVFNKA